MFKNDSKLYFFSDVVFAEKSEIIPAYKELRKLINFRQSPTNLIFLTISAGFFFQKLEFSRKNRLRQFLVFSIHAKSKKYPWNRF